MSEIFAAKYAIPHMLEQGSGYLLNVASAAGLLVIFDTVSYTVTKHAAVGIHGVAGGHVRRPGHRRQPAVPAAVRTPILAGKDGSPQARGVITTDQLVDIVIEGARRGALHDLHAPLGTREVRDQGARLRGVHQGDACRPCCGGLVRCGAGLSRGGPVMRETLDVRREGACSSPRSRPRP